MFDFAWSEFALIAAVALVVIGPKDLPVAIRAISGFIKKARRMAAEFQTHVDEMVREADLKDVKDSINQIRNFDFRSTVEKAIDPDGSIRSTFSDDPLAATANGEAAAAEPATPEVEEPWVEPEPPPPAKIPAPPFVPPALVPFAAGAPPPEPPPPFIPPAPMLQRPAP